MPKTRQRARRLAWEAEGATRNVLNSSMFQCYNRPDYIDPTVYIGLGKDILRYRFFLNFYLEILQGVRSSTALTAQIYLIWEVGRY